MRQMIELATRNQQKAWEIIRQTDIENSWRSTGADINLVGSLSMGLLMKHRDIDFHIYSSSVSLADDFRIMAKLAENPAIRKIEYANLLNTDEACLEWHAWYEDEEHELWQIDMIHLLKGSRYEGYFENVAKRIAALLTDEIKYAILKLKFETPETEKIMGIIYYQAVIQGGVRTYTEFKEWIKQHPVSGIIEWIP
ncbi:phosphoglycerate mutase family protein [Barnesiella propionica]|uniref:phosphoglycerate mutase family protein n=1 Tax=Barnesiella propionica TaxID=2981781 RepID=UPI0011C80A1F|nr:phosphoglycerate mutase family protein [Barnesiella propionica]MCU6769961.1 phosphoglycerate mutase family protein [Barnesiella propionica]